MYTWNRDHSLEGIVKKSWFRVLGDITRSIFTWAKEKKIWTVTPKSFQIFSFCDDLLSAGIAQDCFTVSKANVAIYQEI